MTLKTYELNGVTIVQVPVTTVDISNVDEFRTAMSAVLQDAQNIVIDLDQVEFVDSSALGAFLSFLRRLNAAGGDLKLARMRKSVRTLFELVRMHRVFEIVDTPEAAVELFNQAGSKQ